MFAKELYETKRVNTTRGIAWRDIKRLNEELYKALCNEIDKNVFMTNLLKEQTK